MVRVRGALVILQMAGHARRAVQGVVVIQMAVGALPRWHGVHPGQRKSGGGVIKLGIGPQHGVVALLAGCWEASMRHWRSCVVVIGLMATDARRAGDAIVIVDVTIAALARRDGMRAGQRESGLRVIEGRRLPCRRVVARLAGLFKSARNVVRVRAVLKILQMTRYASRAWQVVVVVDVAIGALPRRDSVGASQSKVHHGVVEGRWGPCHRGMALRAV